MSPLRPYTTSMMLCMALCPLHGTLSPLRQKCSPLQPLFPLWPSAPSTALCFLYSPLLQQPSASTALCFNSPLYPRQPFVPSIALCPLYCTLSPLQPSVSSSSLCTLYGPLSPSTISVPSIILCPSTTLCILKGHLPPLYSPLSSL
jgi:hypothetical protein